jgi:hypothetical protein
LIDLLFTDIVMPGGMNGKQLETKARAKRPEITVLFGQRAGPGRRAGRGRRAPEQILPPV